MRLSKYNEQIEGILRAEEKWMTVDEVQSHTCKRRNRPLRRDSVYFRLLYLVIVKRVQQRFEEGDLEHGRMEFRIRDDGGEPVEDPQMWPSLALWIRGGG